MKQRPHAIHYRLDVCGLSNSCNRNGTIEWLNACAQCSAGARYERSGRVR